MFGMVIVAFLVNNKDEKIRFFKKAFLLANVSSDIVLGISFFTLSNANVRFLEQQLLWQAYTIAETLSNTHWIEVIDWKEFTAAALDKDKEAFVVHVTSFFFPEDQHKVQLALLFADETPVTMPSENSKFINIFSS